MKRFTQNFGTIGSRETDLDARITFKLNVREKGCEVVDWVEMGLMVSSCEHGNGNLVATEYKLCSENCTMKLGFSVHYTFRP